MSEMLSSEAIVGEGGGDSHSPASPYFLVLI